MSSRIRTIDWLIPGILLVIVVIFRGPQLASQIFAAQDARVPATTAEPTPDAESVSDESNTTAAAGNLDRTEFPTNRSQRPKRSDFARNAGSFCRQQGDCHRTYR